jgi:prophage regulatory protein
MRPDTSPISEIRRLRLPEVCALTGLSKSHLYREIAANRFPKQRRFSHKVAYWLESDVREWLLLSELHEDVRALL